jgi:hypothetical protein
MVCLAREWKSFPVAFNFFQHGAAALADGQVGVIFTDMG